MKKELSKIFPLFLIGGIVGAIIGGGAVFIYNSGNKSNNLSSARIGQNIIQVDSNQELSDSDASAAYIKFRKIKKSFIPSGVPAVYGQELSVSFDEVQDAINKIKLFGPTYGSEDKKIVLSGSDLERYIRIGSQTACEYCCGVTTLVEPNGDASCGCAHSIMMRGLSAYLIKNHPNLSDDEILAELNIWKRTYFPKQTLSAELYRLEEAGDSDIAIILKEFPDFLPQMVGGC